MTENEIYLIGVYFMVNSVAVCVFVCNRFLEYEIFGFENISICICCHMIFVVIGKPTDRADIFHNNRFSL